MGFEVPIHILHKHPTTKIRINPYGQVLCLFPYKNYLFQNFDPFIASMLMAHDAYGQGLLYLIQSKTSHPNSGYPPIPDR